MPLIFVPTHQDSELRLDWRELVAILQDLRENVRYFGCIYQEDQREEDLEELTEMVHDALVIANRVGRTLMLDTTS